MPPAAACSLNLVQGRSPRAHLTWRSRPDRMETTPRTGRWCTCSHWWGCSQGRSKTPPQFRDCSAHKVAGGRWNPRDSPWEVADRLGQLGRIRVSEPHAYPVRTLKTDIAGRTPHSEMRLYTNHHSSEAELSPRSAWLPSLHVRSDRSLWQDSEHVRLSHGIVSYIMKKMFIFHCKEYAYLIDSIKPLY